MEIREIEKLELLIKELTTEEKLHMLSSGSGGIERLGIPDCMLGGEAAHGVVARNWRNGELVKDITTSFPQPVGMSSSWDKEAIRKAGEVVGREARIEFHKNKWGGISRWAPTVDLLRDPRWGRNEEAYGEDPVQVGAMASAYIKGMCGDDPEHPMAAATLKHFYGNNTEIGRGWKNSSISPADKYEMYLEPFRRCIEDGGACGVMTAYNRINGVLGMFNPEVNTILKNEFGLDHVVSDGGAMELSAAFAHATASDAETVAMAIRAGVDAISSNPESVYKAAKEAFELGLITENDLDNAIMNVYRTRIKLGLFDDRYPKGSLGELCDEGSARICRDMTDRSVVLLKNSGILPLKDEDLDDCVLIGPVGDKWYMDWYGSESPEQISLLEGLGHGMKYTDACDRIRLRCGDRFIASDPEGRVRLSDEPDTYVLEDWGEGSYTLRNDRTGKYLITKLSSDAIEGIAAAEAGAKPGTIAGKVYADSDRIFSWFDLEVFRIGDGNGEGGSVISDRFGNRLYADKDGYVVTSGADHPGLTPLSFSVETVGSGIEEAVAAAAGAKTVIMALGCNPMVNAKEEIDRATIDFIPYQQKLFDEVSRVNPNTVVVLMCNYPYSVCEIDRNAAALVWSATGSQCMGRSLADVLTGKVRPAGRLTQTWYKSDRDIPDMDDYDLRGAGRTYRYFSGDVLYPFGFGLTYTSFAYSDLKVSVSGERNASDPSARIMGGHRAYDNVRSDKRVLEIGLKVTNTGSMVSDEVVQIYSKSPAGSLDKARIRLIGFERVRDIVPGMTADVVISVPVRELAVFDTARGALIIEGGRYEILAGASSLDTRVSAFADIDGLKAASRDLTGIVRAEMYDDQEGAQITEGLYGFSALMAAGPGTDEPRTDGAFRITYDKCPLPDNALALRIHGYAPSDASLKIYLDDRCVGKLTLNTRDYEAAPSEARNRMPRAVCSEERRISSRSLMWAEIRLPLELNDLPEPECSTGYRLGIEACGPFKYDRFTVICDDSKDKD